MASHSFRHTLSGTGTSTAIHLHMRILINVWSTPMLGPSHPSAVHDELLSQLVTCKIKNIKWSAGSTIITPKGSFKRNFVFIYESLYSHLKSCIILLLYCTVLLLLYCMDAYAPSLPSIRANAHTMLVSLWFDRHADIKNRLTDVEAET